MAADEHGCGGWRDGVQARPSLGLRHQGNRALQGQDRLRRGQLLGSHHERRVLEYRSLELRRFWTLHAWFRGHTLQRSRSTREDRQGSRCLRIHGGADSGRGWRRRT